MKKLIGTVVVAALLATTAFAEGISFGSWGRGLWSVGNAANGKVDASDTSSDPVADKNDVSSWISQSWGGAAPRTALSVRGNSENVGFALDIFGNGGTVSGGDNIFIWVKPVEMLTLSLTAADDRNVLRSGAAFGLYNFARIGAVSATNDDGFLFPAYLNKRLSAVATPIDGLTIGAGFNMPIGDGQKAVEGNRFVDQIGRSLGVAAGYTIADIGTIKAGLSAEGRVYEKNNIKYSRTNKDGEVKDLIKIAAAFELTAIENVFVGVGAIIPVGGTYGTLTGGNENPIKINAYGKLTMIENLTINITAALALNSGDKKEAKKDGAFGFGFGAEVEYALSNGLTLFGDVRYANGILLSGTSADKSDTLTLGAGLWKGFSNGNIGVAFEGTTNGVNAQADIYDNAFAWQVPVRFEYSF